MKVTSKGKFKMECSFMKRLSQNFEVLTLSEDVINPKWVKKVQLDISYINVDRKIKTKSKRYLEVTSSFMKPFSKMFQVLT